MRFLKYLLLIVTTFLLIGCGSSNSNTSSSDDSDSSDVCLIGSETCSCTAGDGCDLGLTCASGICVDLAIDDSETDSLVRFLTYTFFDQKMMGLFTILFGAGFYLFIDRLDKKQLGLKVIDIYTKRLLWQAGLWRRVKKTS